MQNLRLETPKNLTMALTAAEKDTAKRRDWDNKSIARKKDASKNKVMNLMNRQVKHQIKIILKQDKSKNLKLLYHQKRGSTN